ncbi:MAG: class I SAM-dependent methyltransferase [Dehalococcoidia bacterium]
MSLLDCGCGPGSITTGLAQALAPSEVADEDIEASQIDQAKTHAANQGNSNRRFEAASVSKLPFPDCSIDAAFGQATLHHLGDPLRALEKMLVS